MPTTCSRRNGQRPEGQKYAFYRYFSMGGIEIIFNAFTRMDWLKKLNLRVRRTFGRIAGNKANKECKVFSVNAESYMIPRRTVNAQEKIQVPAALSRDAADAAAMERCGCGGRQGARCERFDVGVDNGGVGGVKSV
ncbi:hypothetical protein [Paenibacillus pabuli]|uniref:hypothetical protein n=1 Tax=Paenibacillus pabuli TaxID=1472 RepID=UPI001FE0D914|nr:hypothetical protein [Paenibacillus pabuli]MEC0128405.1 hypothetical protein [Paenibacillus pabuli]